MKRGFYHLSKAWYAKAVLENQKYEDEVTFGLFCEGGGTKGELCVRWYDLIENKPLVARLECFEDAWLCLSKFKDVLDEMAEVDNTCIQPEGFCQLLIKCGLQDLTPIKNPYE